MAFITKNLSNEKGVALIFSLLILMILTLLAEIGINTVVSGISNIKGYKNGQLRLYLADSGVEYGYALVERAMANNQKVSSTDLGNTSITIETTDSNGDGITDLEDEILGRTVASSDSYTDATPNVSIDLSNMGVTSVTPDNQNVLALDIDFVRSKRMGGSSSEFASRYEGIGSGGSGGVGFYYKIDSYYKYSSSETTTIEINYKCIEGSGRCL
jgi:Tfp pilus assembly protein PilX